MAAILAFDFGGSSRRAALIDDGGATLASATLDHGLGDAVEAGPADWWYDLQTLSDALAATAATAFDGVAAVAISAFTRTQVLLDQSGAILRPAMLWSDSRAEVTVASLRDRIAANHPEYSRLDGFHPLARLWWLKAHEPATIGRLAQVVEPKDYLNFCLTGRLAGDPVSLARLAASRDLLSAIGLSPTILPELLPPTGILAPVQAGLPGALGRLVGRPVLTMAHDSWAAVAGLGALRLGFGYNLSGTTEVLGILSGEPAKADGLLDLAWGSGLYQLGGPSQTGADSLRWVADLCGLDLGRDLDIVLNQPRAAEPVLFLPYLRGERTPFWDARLRGAFIGLNRTHRPVDLVWAVMEGIACLNRLVLERAERGRPIAELRLGGGGAANPHWAQVKADLLGRRVVVTDSAESGLRGAAIVAWTALGRFADLDQAQAALARPVRVFEPDPGRRAYGDRLYRLFLQAHAALAPLSHQLADWPTDRL